MADKIKQLMEAITSHAGATKIAQDTTKQILRKIYAQGKLDRSSYVFISGFNKLAKYGEILAIDENTIRANIPMSGAISENVNIQSQALIEDITKNMKITRAQLVGCKIVIMVLKYKINIKKYSKFIKKLHRYTIKRLRSLYKHMIRDRVPYVYPVYMGKKIPFKKWQRKWEIVNATKDELTANISLKRSNNVIIKSENLIKTMTQELGMTAAAPLNWCKINIVVVRK